VVALTRDLHVFASCIATGWPAVFFALRYKTKAWDVSAHSVSGIRHYGHLLIRLSFRLLPLQALEAPWLVTHHPFFADQRKICRESSDNFVMCDVCMPFSKRRPCANPRLSPFLPYRGKEDQLSRVSAG